MGIFNLDGPFYRFGNAMADIMILSLLWILFSIPLFTIGASTTAMFYVTTRRISNREGYLLRDFFSSFKANFKMATLLWLLWVAMAGLIFFNLRILGEIEFDPLLATILFPVQVIILVELFVTSLYLFPLMARFDMTMRQTVKSAFFMANRHLLTTFSAVATAVAIVFAAAMWFEPILLVGMGLYAYATSYMFMNVFKKYRPEIDAEDLGLEPLPMLNLDEVLEEAEEEQAEGSDEESDNAS